MCPNVVKAIEV